MSYDPLTGQPLTDPAAPAPSPKSKFGLPGCWTLAAILTPAVAFILSLVILFSAGVGDDQIHFRFPYLAPLLLLAVPITAIVLGLARRKSDKRYEKVWAVGIAFAFLTLFASFPAVLPGLFFERKLPERGGLEATTLFEDYREAAGVTWPDLSEADYWSWRSDDPDQPEEERKADPACCAVLREGWLRIRDGETAEAFLEQVGRNDRWTDRLPNSLYGCAPAEFREPWTSYSGPDTYRYETRVLVLNADTGAYNAAPAAPGVYRFVACQYTLCRSEKTGEVVYGYLQLCEYEVNYVG